MRLLLSTASVACLLPFAAAFYPYNPDGAEPTPSSTGRRSLRFSRASQHDGFTLPLRRTPVRRDNQYSILSAATPTQSASVGVHQDGSDYSYMATLKLGTSNEDYLMLLDSGASNTWVMSSTCTTESCNAHDTFGPSDSTTLQVTNTAFRIVYGTGQVNGVLASDDAHFAGFTVPLTFGLASNASAEFLSYPMDGLMGLGRADTTSSNIGPTIIDVLAQRGLIPRRLYGIALHRAADGPNDGELNLGAPNTNRYTGELSYIPAITNTNGFWEIRVDNAGVNGGEGGSADLRGRTAILDTGTSFILMPPADAQKLHAQITGSAQVGEAFTVPCDTEQTIQFTLGGVKYGIPSIDFVGANVGGSTCRSNIIGRQTFGPNQWLVGATFFKNLYAVFDYEGQRVGLGVKQIPPPGASSTAGSGSTSTAPTSASGTSSSLSSSVSLMPPPQPTTSSVPPASSSTSAAPASSNTVAPISPTSTVPPMSSSNPASPVAPSSTTSPMSSPSSVSPQSSTSSVPPTSSSASVPAVSPSGSTPMVSSPTSVAPGSSSPVAPVSPGSTASMSPSSSMPMSSSSFITSVVSPSVSQVSPSSHLTPLPMEPVVTVTEDCTSNTTMSASTSASTFTSELSSVHTTPLPESSSESATPAPTHPDTEIPVSSTDVPEVATSAPPASTPADSTASEPVSTTDAPIADATDSASPTSTTDAGAPAQGDAEPQTVAPAAGSSEPTGFSSTGSAPAAASSSPMAFDSAAERQGPAMSRGQALALAVAVVWGVVWGVVG